MKDMLFSLCSACFIGSVREAAELAKQLLSPLSDRISQSSDGTVRAVIFGESERSIMLEAHIDEIGMIVTGVADGGFLRVAAVGGVDVRTLPSTRVTVHGKQRVPGVFTSTPPHLASGQDKQFPQMDELLVDTGRESLEGIVSVGDFITFDSQPVCLQNDYVTGKSMDDRTGVAALIRAAQLIKQRGKPPYTIVLSLCSGEELGNRGAVSEAFSLEPERAIAVDVSFGLSPHSPPEHCGTLGAGSMIGVSPVLSYEITERLKELAMDKGIAVQMEIMGGKTGTDADIISLTRQGVPTGLLSIPLRYMHTPVETAKLTDIEATAELLCEYAFDKGE